MIYAIESGIPIPPPMKRSNLKRGYPWRVLGVGDSFFVPSGDMHRLHQSVVRQNKRTRQRYCVRTLENGVRVWRTA